MRTQREDVRNIAIIAHVDHGKTTLVDELVKTEWNFPSKSGSSGTCHVDSNDIERERVSPFFPKTLLFTIKETKINIIDTPGHADFGGEVERVLKMVNGVILVVDAFEARYAADSFRIKESIGTGFTRNRLY